MRGSLPNLFNPAVGPEEQLWPFLFTITRSGCKVSATLQPRSLSKAEISLLSSGPFSEFLPVCLDLYIGAFEKCIAEMNPQVCERELKVWVLLILTCPGMGGYQKKKNRKMKLPIIRSGAQPKINHSNSALLLSMPCFSFEGQRDLPEN